MNLAYLPSPDTGVWQIGPIPLRAYALAIITGVVVAIVVGERRWQARGGAQGVVTDVATIAVPFGILGARVYHVITSPQAYLDDPVSALYVWEGGLGIPGGIAGGFLAAYVMLRRRGLSRTAFADAVAPGVVLAQAVGRLGNWFNQELFGAPTDLPWGLRIDPTSPTFPDGLPADTLFHPTFLYEMLWNLAAAAVLIWADRRFRLGHGRVFWLYVVLYTSGRVWIEALRIDPAETVLGLRLNVWTSILVGCAALVAFVVVGRRHPGRETTVQLRSQDGQDAQAVEPS